MGRGIKIPGLGVFTFSAAENDITGVTNPQKRVHHRRFPYFRLEKNFVKGIELKPGIVLANTGKIRPFEMGGKGGI